MNDDAFLKENSGEDDDDKDKFTDQLEGMILFQITINYRASW